MSIPITRRTFIKKGSLFIPGVLASTSLLGVLQGCSSTPVLFTTQALGALGAAVTILDYLGIRPSFSNAINYTESSQCRPDFQRDEGYMRGHGMKVFAGVRRSPFDADVAVMVGAQTVSQKSNGQASVQFKANPSVNLHEKDLDAIRAAAAFVKQHYNFSNRDVAQAIAITQKKTIPVLDEVTGTTVPVIQFTDARGGYTLFNPKPSGELARFTHGTIRVYQPQYSDQDNLPIIGLES